MPTCDLTGKECERVVEVLIEGVVMNVAPDQAKFGKPVQREVSASQLTQKRTFAQSKPTQPQVYEFIVPNAGVLIKQAREKLGLRQIDLAKKLLIKESTIHQVESGHLKPTQSEAKKVEDGLGITITASQKITSDNSFHSEKSAGFTIGDMIKDKRKK